MQFLKNVCLSAVSLVVTLLLCEAGTRIMLPPPKDVDVTVEKKTNSAAPQRAMTDNKGEIAPVIDWSGPHGVRLFPNVNATIHNHTLSHQDVVLNINSLGLRYRELSPDKGDEFRILAVGDSITFGDYVDETQTIPAIIERELGRTRTETAVINAGLPGANTNDEFFHYIELRDSVKPDVVLLGMYLNDSQNSEQFYAKKLAFPFSRSRFLSFVSERLHFLNMQQSVKNVGIDPNWKEEFRHGRDLKTGNMTEDRDAFDFEIYNASQDFGLAWNEQAWKNLSEITDTFARAVSEKGQKLLIFFLPIHIQVYGTDAASSTYPQEKFKEMCGKLNLTCLDMLPTLREAAKTIPMHDMYYDHCHYRVPGNEIIGKKLAEWISTHAPKA